MGVLRIHTAQKMKFSIKDFFSICEQNFIFCYVSSYYDITDPFCTKGSFQYFVFSIKRI